MKMNSGDISTTVSADVDELVFSVDDEDQGFIFEMLRSKIYSDPIAAICREIASNSRDANREVMKGHVPVEIGIREEHPLNGDSSLHVYFKDEGPGISPDRMANVFCKYAKSTKRDTDELTGGFGLGAKTPFAYTDAFTIITNVDGVCYTYTAYIDESRRGKIAKLDQRETKDPNGTTIMVPINPYDRNDFERNIYRYTMYWDVVPKYVNFGRGAGAFEPSFSYVLKSGRVVFAISSTNHFSRKHGILVDGIPYDCQLAQLPRYKECSDGSTSGYKLIIKANTGDVDLSVNRETLNYTQTTITYIDEVFEELREAMSDDVSGYVTGSNNYFEACAKAYSVLKERSLVLRDAKGASLGEKAKNSMSWLREYTPDDVVKMFDFTGKPVTMNYSTMQHMRFQLAYLSDNGNPAYKDISFGLLFFYQREIYAFDTRTKSVERTNSILRAMDSRKEFILVSDKQYVPVKGMNQQAIDDATAEFAKGLAADKAEFDNFQIPVKSYSAVPITSKSKSKAQRNEIINVPVREFRPTSSMSNKSSIVINSVRVRRGDGPVDDKGDSASHEIIYIVSSDISKLDEFDHASKQIAAYMIACYRMSVIIVPKRLAHHFKDCLDLETAKAGIDVALLQKIVNAGETVKQSTEIVNFGLMNINFNNDKMRNRIVWITRASKLYQKTRLMRELNKFDVIGEIATMMKVLPNVKLDDVSVYLENFYKAYPLLGSYSLKYDVGDAGKRKAIEQYIRLVDAEKRRNMRNKSNTV